MVTMDRIQDLCDRIAREFRLCRYDLAYVRRYPLRVVRHMTRQPGLIGRSRVTDGLLAEAAPAGDAAAKPQAVRRGDEGRQGGQQPCHS